SGASVSHTYAQTSTYTVMLTVTDNGGGSSSSSKTVALIQLTATGYKVKALRNVDLAWTGPSGGFDVHRNGGKIATVSETSYIDNLSQKGPGSYVYKVCAVAAPACSNAMTVTF